METRLRNAKGQFTTRSRKAAEIAVSRGVQILSGSGMLLKGVALVDALRRGGKVIVVSAKTSEQRRMVGYEAANLLIARAAKAAAKAA